MKEESIVITGIGLATPLGMGKESSWEKIKKGVCVTSTALPENIPSDLSCFTRQAPLLNPNGLPRVFPLSLAAAQEAIQDSGVQFSELSPERIGCSVSVSKPIFCSPNVSHSPFSILYSLPDSVGKFLCRELKIGGPIENLIAACATGVHSILTACRWLKEKSCDIALAGSAESSLHPLYIAGFKQMGVLSDFPCPFDRRRKGFMLGEGAGILVLERKSDALARRAKIYAEILGGALGSDTSHPTAFDAEGDSIARFLKKGTVPFLGDCPLFQVDYMNLHGTGTKLNDLMETRAIKKVFGKTAYELSLSSTKAATGHLLGASGSVEVIICALAMQENFVPPTVNLEIPDPECDLDYTSKTGKSKKIETALSLSFGFGGTIAAIALKK